MPRGRSERIVRWRRHLVASTCVVVTVASAVGAVALIDVGGTPTVLGREPSRPGSTSDSPSATASSTSPPSTTTPPPTAPPTAPPTVTPSSSPTVPPTTPPKSPTSTPSSSPTGDPSETPDEPSDPDEPSAAEQEVVDRANAERADAGCDPLTVDDRLTAAARGHSHDMRVRDYFSHESPEGETFGDRAGEQGYDAAGGENIALGYADADAVMDGWMDSEGHRRNILNCDFSSIGVGVEEGQGGPWWTQVFGYE